MKQIILFVLITLSYAAKAQMNEEDVALIGIRGGYVYSSTLNDIRNMVVPRDRHPETWPHTEEQSRTGYYVGIFGHQRIKKWPFVLQLEFSYATLGGDLKTDVPDTLFRQYAEFKYNYFAGALFANWHPLLPDVANDANAFSGIHLGLGISYNFILKKEAITFVSHVPSVDPPIQDYMNTYIKGASHPAILLKGGYEYFWNNGQPGSGFGITLDARMGFGLGNAAKASSFIYENVKVRMQYIVFTAGILFPLSH